MFVLSGHSRLGKDRQVNDEWILRNVAQACKPEERPPALPRRPPQSAMLAVRTEGDPLEFVSAIRSQVPHTTSLSHQLLNPRG